MIIYATQMSYSSMYDHSSATCFSVSSIFGYHSTFGSKFLAVELLCSSGFEKKNRTSFTLYACNYVTLFIASPLISCRFFFVIFPWVCDAIFFSFCIVCSACDCLFFHHTIHILYIKYMVDVIIATFIMNGKICVRNKRDFFCLRTPNKKHG